MQKKRAFVFVAFALLFVTVLYYSVMDSSERNVVSLVEKCLSSVKVGKLNEFSLIDPLSLKTIKELVSHGTFENDITAIKSIERDKYVVRLMYLTSQGRRKDTYLFITHKNKWIVSGIRQFSLIEPYEAFLEEAKENKDYEVGNAKLVLMSDFELKSWFLTHEKEMNAIVKLCYNGNINTVSASDSKNIDISKYLKDLHLHSIKKSDNGNYFVTIGGMVDNHVGFIYSKKEKVPKINPSNYIWLEQIAPCWFLYRTT